jgi:tRNA modification GTPase
MRGLASREAPPRRATLAAFLDAKGEALDQGLLLYFPAPQSFTGEDVVELQGHGGPEVMRLILERCLALGARVARPGEFTERAFLNGKLDLSQAEAVADLIEATTGAAARAALRNLEGALSQAIRGVQEALTELRVWVEGALDFPEEELEVLPDAAARDRLAAILEGLENILGRAGSGRLLSEGLHIVLVGRPNVGKSSLLNRLVGRDAAIVTPVPGTTRDALREALQLNGVPLYLTDTAGLRETEDEVERLGIDRTYRAIGTADLALLVGEATVGWTEEDRVIESRLEPGLKRIRVLNKADLLRTGASADASAGGLLVSAVSGEGIERLREGILEAAGWQGQESDALMAHARHLEALERALVRLRNAVEVVSKRELLAEELRLAQEALGEITGEFVADDLLGEIFARFCIGK